MNTSTYRPEPAVSSKVSLLSTLIILATGVILCIASGIEDSTRIIIFVAGASFMLASVVNIVMLSSVRDSRGYRRRSVFSSVVGWIVSVAGIGLGLTMLVTPGTFMTSLVYLFGAILVVAGLWQAFVFMRGLPGLGYPGWVYIMPVLTVADGAVMLFYDLLRDDMYSRYVVLMMGIGMIIISVANAVVFTTISRYNRRLRRGEVPAVHAAADSHAADDGDSVEPSI